MKTPSRFWRPVTLSVAIIVAAALSTGVSAQDKAASEAPAGDLQALFSGKTHPIALKLKDLDSGSWRRVKVSGGADKKEEGGLGALLGGLFGGGGALGGMMNSMLSGTSTAGADVYYTRGQTVVLGGETYLVAYQPQTKDVDFGMLMKMKDMESPPPPKPLTPESPLAMSLLNLHSIGNLTGIRPFDLQSEIAASEEMAKSLEQIGKEQAKEKHQNDGVTGADPFAEDPKPAPPKHTATPVKKKATTKTRSSK